MGRKTNVPVVKCGDLETLLVLYNESFGEEVHLIGNLTAFLYKIQNWKLMLFYWT